MEKNKTRRSFERNKGRSFDYKISDIWIYKSFDFFEGNCLFWNLVVGFKRSVKMFQKTFEVLQELMISQQNIMKKSKLTVIHMKILRKDYVECLMWISADLIPQEIIW